MQISKRFHILGHIKVGALDTTVFIWNMDTQSMIGFMEMDLIPEEVNQFIVKEGVGLG